MIYMMFMCTTYFAAADAKYNDCMSDSRPIYFETAERCQKFAQSPALPPPPAATARYRVEYKCFGKPSWQPID